MKKRLIYIYIISLLVPSFLKAQESKDSVANYQHRYGLRFGVDISKLIRHTLDKEYFGVEGVADFRVHYKYYVAAEGGFERKTTITDLLAFQTVGSFLKLGVDYNTYTNWYGMENMIYIGGRYAASLFDQDLQRYDINNRNNDYWQESLVGNNADILRIYPDRKSHWVELLAGIKVELFHNLYASMDIRLKKMLYNKSDEFPDFWIPGFGRVWENSSIGVGFNYTITYLIPFYKKSSRKEKVK